MRIDFSVLQEKVRVYLKGQRETCEELDRKIGILSSHVYENPDEIFKKEIDEWNEKHDLKRQEVKREVEIARREMLSLVGKLKEDEKLKEIKIQLKKKITHDTEIWTKLVSKRSGLKVLSSQERNKLDKLGKLEGECPTCFQQVNHADNCKMISECNEKLEHLQDMAVYNQFLCLQT